MALNLSLDIRLIWSRLICWAQWYYVCDNISKTNGMNRFFGHLASYGLITLRKLRSPVIISGERGIFRLNPLLTIEGKETNRDFAQVNTPSPSSKNPLAAEIQWSMLFWNESNTITQRQFNSICSPYSKLTQILQEIRLNRDVLVRRWPKKIWTYI